MSSDNDYQTYKLGDFKLKSGGEITDAFIAYKTLGDPSLPAIIYPTWYSGSKHDPSATWPSQC
jgi:homoserine acetyltransferase